MKKIIAFALTIIFMLSIAASNVLAANINELKKDEKAKIQPRVVSSVTKAEFAVMLHDALKIEIRYFVAPNIEKIFSDVKNNDPYADKLYNLVTVGIVDDTKVFNPNSKITREQAVHYLMRAYNYAVRFKSIETEKIPASIYLSKNYTQAFSDVKDFNKTFIKDIVKANHLKMINLKIGKKFSPKAYLTRYEALQMVNSLKRLVAGQPKDNNNALTITPSYLFTGNSLVLTAELENKSNSTITIDYTSGNQYNFVILDEDKNVIYNWVADKMFIQALTKVTLKPGEKKVFTDTLENVENNLKEKAAYLRVEIPGKIGKNEVQPVEIKMEKVLK